ncbi:acyl-CoA thioesterase [Haloplanus rubicundus]|uniref:Acyl-CoA thioesterase n=1 Tax=Haloplanus rubicundus TaxID=1547898 RepID=A0A345E659_9EURY|nr:acyl-CoA thioesterase [Haloplanus rubicundus]AXG07681.1 acyl-CoA thioesterase [Haloplanus rubicundus]AXG11100.1 acyl-CoA thioesterase [Haloplanus rubicundus]
MTAEPATLAESHTEMTEIVLPNDTNTHGRALGGVVLHWMDVCGAIAAMRFANEGVVTASMEHVDFKRPIDLGEVVVVEAYVYDTGRTSLDVTVEVRAENPRTDTERATTSSFFTFVAVDDDGDPTPVPDLDCPTEGERRLRDAALDERAAQLERLVERMEDSGS